MRTFSFYKVTLNINKSQQYGLYWLNYQQSVEQLITASAITSSSKEEYSIQLRESLSAPARAKRSNARLNILRE
jgi:hypothetical protein